MYMQRREDKRERVTQRRTTSRHPVLMHKCVCLTEGVCKLKHIFNIKRNVSF